MLRCSELIDTLWNVNLKGFETVLPCPGINRYIMECKLQILIILSDHKPFELIDTLWNVNSK